MHDCDTVRAVTDRTHQISNDHQIQRQTLQTLTQTVDHLFRKKRWRKWRRWRIRKRGWRNWMKVGERGERLREKSGEHAMTMERRRRMGVYEENERGGAVTTVTGTGPAWS